MHRATCLYNNCRHIIVHNGMMRYTHIGSDAAERREKRGSREGRGRKGRRGGGREEGREGRRGK